MQKQARPRQPVGLRAIFLAIIGAVFVVSTVAFVSFDMGMRTEQMEDSLAEEARTFAREMDSVWTFMENSQYIINTDSSGNYEFKGLHCSIVGKSVGQIFSARNDYSIRYTNFNPRNVQDVPDSFEEEALAAFYSNPGVKEYYAVEPGGQEDAFRYLQALEVDESCLECHGSPAGELDITGHVKEGWTTDTVGGAISITIPMAQQKRDLAENVARDVAFFLILTVMLGAAVFMATEHFVIRPLNRMRGAFDEMRGGNLDAQVSRAAAAKEVALLIDEFNNTERELKRMYESLDEQVEDRTRELARANLELTRQREDLERLSEELAKEASFKGNLLSMVNHELRTPLTSIILLARTTREAAARVDEAEMAALKDIENSSSVLLRMINDMLDIARSDAGQMRTSREPMDLGDVVYAASMAIQPLAKQYRVGFVTRVAADVPLVIGDCEKTQRIMENLCSNAVKFTPDGGEVALEVRREPGGGVSIEVSDTGIGIDPSDHERIFERFVQVDSTSTRKYNGSGLGLALVKEYAEAQGFSVSLDSRLGEGSRFSVTIPQGLVI